MFSYPNALLWLHGSTCIFQTALQIMRFHSLALFSCLSLWNHFNLGLSACSLQSSVPIYLPIKNITLSQQVQKRGIPLSVGTPEQTLVFAADCESNNTHLYGDPNDRQCAFDPPGILPCFAQTGGFLDKEKSSSWRQAMSFDTLPTLDTDVIDQKTLQGSETIRISPNLTFSNFPIGIEIGAKDAWRNKLGLARNSTLLNRLSSAGSIYSRTWAYYHGWTGAETQHQLDGRLVLGGYDEAKTMGQNTTISFFKDGNCSLGLLVTILDIKMNFRDGTQQSIFDQSARSAMDACLVPSIPLLNLPFDLWSSFVRYFGVSVLGRSLGINNWAMLISSNGSYDGDLTMTLSSGLQITIPNHQLVLPDYHVNSQGRFIVNGSDRVVLINSLQEINRYDMPLLGQPFFSSTYLLVNQDTAQFTLWKSNPTTTRNLLAIGEACDNDSISRVSTLTSVLSSPSASTSTDSGLPTPTSMNRNRRMNNGTIVGISVGAIAGIALLCGGIIRIKKKKKRQRISQDSQAQNNFITNNACRQIQECNHGALFIKPELPSDRQPPQEMPLTQNPPCILSPYELPVFQRYELNG